MTPHRLARLLAWLAGGMDFLTGLGLVAAPVTTLALMQIAAPGAEAQLYVRFVGAFVASVGASYLWALAGPAQRLRVVLGVTVLPRLAAGSFTGTAVLCGALPPFWLAVTVTDFALVAAQRWLLARWSEGE